MSDDKKAQAALADAKASLQTARISLDELDKLRAATRGPLPSLDALIAFVGASADTEDAKAMIKLLGLRRRAVAGGADLVNRATGVRFSVEGDAGGYSAWTGPLQKGLSMASAPTQVALRLGPAELVHADGVDEHCYTDGRVVQAYVLGDDGIAQLRLRLRNP